MSDFKIHTLETAPEESRPELESVKDQWGMIPNLIGVFAESAPVVKAYLTLGDLFGQTSFDAVERHVIWLTINVENQCHYCIPAHSAMALNDGVAPEIVEALRNGEPLEDSKLQALRRFTAQMVRDRGDLSDSEIAKFLEAGYERRHVLEVILGIAHKTLSNYTNHVAETPVDGPFSKFEWDRTEAA